jgi:hypothetical protein
MGDETAGPCADPGADGRTCEQGRREDQPEDRSSDRAPARALGGRVQVVVDVDLAVGVAADEDQPVDLDRARAREILDGVPVSLAASASAYAAM